MNIGILGGTFDPVHLGHIKLAEEAKRLLRLKKVVFVPAYLPPHKLDRKISPYKDRYNMIKLAIEKLADYELSDIEMRLKGASYSINTIKEFKKLYGDKAQIFFITGSDSVEELKSWKDVEELKACCNFVIATRPTYTVSSQPENTKIINVDTPDISSSKIRSLIKEKRPCQDLLPIGVYNYIIKRRLYL